MTSVPATSDCDDEEVNVSGGATEWGISGGIEAMNAFSN